jgi:TPR repeat protein
MAGPLGDATAAYDCGDYATTLRLLRALAEQADAVAERKLGALYLDGKGMPYCGDDVVSGALIEGQTQSAFGHGSPFQFRCVGSLLL